MTPKFSGMLGLAMRAGKLSVGESKAADAVRGGKAVLLLLATDTARNTEKRFLNMTQFYQVPCIRPGDRVELGAAIGKKAAVVLAVTDGGFAEQLTKLDGADNQEL